MVDERLRRARVCGASAGCLEHARRSFNLASPNQLPNRPRSCEHKVQHLKKQLNYPGSSSHRSTSTTDWFADRVGASSGTRRATSRACSTENKYTTSVSRPRGYTRRGIGEETRNRAEWNWRERKDFPGPLATQRPRNANPRRRGEVENETLWEST